MSKIINISLRLWELTCSVIVMGLIGNMIADAYSGNPATINYTMFCSAFAMFTLLWLVPDSFLGQGKVPLAAFTFDALNTLLWFCAAIALSSKLEVHSCTNNEYLIHNEITNGAHNMTKRCREAQSSTAFLWFGWAAFLASTFMTGMQAFSGSRRESAPKGAPAAAPAMREV